MRTPTLGALLYAFFENHLKAQKGLRPATIRSYRDAVRLFLTFVAEDRRCRLTRVKVGDLTARRVMDFLNALETERHNHIRSRNLRLTALKGLFDYIAAQRPELWEEAERVMAIPTKRVAPPRTYFLERDELETMFAQMATTGPLALRDRTLLLFLYNTGARVQEVADLRLGNLELDRCRVHLHGKGDKWRTGADPVWHLQDRPAPSPVPCPEVRRAAPVDITPLGPPYHRSPSSRSWCRTQCNPSLAGPREPGDHQSVRGDHPRDEGEGARSMPATDTMRWGIPQTRSLAR